MSGSGTVAPSTALRHPRPEPRPPIARRRCGCTRRAATADHDHRSTSVARLSPGHRIARAVPMDIRGSLGRWSPVTGSVPVPGGRRTTSVGAPSGAAPGRAGVDRRFGEGGGHGRGHPPRCAAGGHRGVAALTGPPHTGGRGPTRGGSPRRTDRREHAPARRERVGQRVRHATGPASRDPPVGRSPDRPSTTLRYGYRAQRCTVESSDTCGATSVVSPLFPRGQGNSKLAAQANTCLARCNLHSRVPLFMCRSTRGADRPPSDRGGVTGSERFTENGGTVSGEPPPDPAAVLPRG